MAHHLMMAAAVVLTLFGLSTIVLDGPSLVVDGFQPKSNTDFRGIPPRWGRCAPVGRRLLATTDSSSELISGGREIHILENISIEYCKGCRWGTKAFWMATELLQRSTTISTTTNDEKEKKRCEQLKEVTVMPSETSGTFLITAKICIIDTNTNEKRKGALVRLWDRKIDGGFPPIDLVEFERRVDACLGEEDVDVLDDGVVVLMSSTGVEDEAKEDENDTQLQQKQQHTGEEVEIRYSKEQNELLRAVYFGQELLTTFCDGELKAVSLRPDQGGFRVGLREHRPLKKERSLGQLWLWDNATSERFPEVKELKQLVRDRVKPQKDLGHSEDTKTTTRITTTTAQVESTANVDNVGECIPCNEDVALSNAEEETKDDDNDDDFFDDDEAEEARRYFGVL